MTNEFTYLSTVLAGIIMSACVNSEKILPSVSGSQNEVLVVIADSVWKSPQGTMLKQILTQEIYGLPQPEPMFDVYQCQPAAFSDMLKPSRNVIIAEISEKYAVSEISFIHNVWAKSQAVAKIEAPNEIQFNKIITQHENQIIDFFITAERNRQIAYNAVNLNISAVNEIEKMFSIRLDVPKVISKITKGQNFIWLMNDDATVHQDIMVYSFQYGDSTEITEQFVIAKRDSITKANIRGEIDGSYMISEKNPKPKFSTINLNGENCAELRGLWKITAMGMGGAFYSCTLLDKKNKRATAIDAFVFAPSRTKRNPLRQLEAIVHSAKILQNTNQQQLNNEQK
ncbi:MAG: DUF4837 family protein [Paludibacter sp.]|jgi:hypothetical protein|nr:DUF4837 family protein [Paludibacter sp.]